MEISRYDEHFSFGKFDYLSRNNNLKTTATQGIA